MGMTYTKEELKKLWEKLHQEPPELLYKKGGDNLFKYTGKVKDDPEMLDMEYISKLMLDDFYILQEIGKNPENLIDTKNFNKNRNKRNKWRDEKFKNIKSPCNELNFSKALYNSDYDFRFGKIKIFHQSLNESNKKSGPGAIDLLSCLNDEIFVIELKTSQSNEETLLRAIMEAFTFVILLNKRKVKFIKEFNLSEKIVFRPGVLSFCSIKSGENMKDLEGGKLPNLRALILRMNGHIHNLGIEPFKFFAFNAQLPPCKQDEQGRIVFRDENFTSSEVVEYVYA